RRSPCRQSVSRVNIHRPLNYRSEEPGMESAERQSSDCAAFDFARPERLYAASIACASVISVWVWSGVSSPAATKSSRERPSNAFIFNKDDARLTLAFWKESAARLRERMRSSLSASGVDSPLIHL